MLKALYDYAMTHNLTPPPGCVKKTVKAWIHLDAQGGFEYIEPVDNETVIAPDIGSLANGKDKSNVLLEKRSVVLPEEESAKSRFFKAALRDGGEVESGLAVCEKALADEDTARAIGAKLDELKIKTSDRISFKVDGVSVLELPHTMEWWSRWRLQFQKSGKTEHSVCLITGVPTVPMATTTPINGLYAVGGHARGDALICFDKTAFCSCDLKKAANAPVSEEAFAAVKAALDKLIADSPTLAGMKFVHWYDAETTDIINQALGLNDRGSEDEDEEEDELTEEELRLEEQREEISQNRQATRLVESVRNGGDAVSLGNAHYFILMLTGVGGRIMVRHYERGNYEELCRNLDKWKDDLKLTNSFGTGPIKPCKLTARLIRLLKYQKTDSKPFQRLEKELSGLTPAILRSILGGGPLPASVAVRALASIRSEMMNTDEERTGGSIPYAYQWLKVWLLRNNRKKGKPEELMENYNWEHSVPAYHFGGMMAVYEAIQRAAMPDVNVNVVQRYYASAIQTPALVLGQLSHRSVHHLEKLENRWLAGKFREYLQLAGSAAGNEIPATLTLPEQSYFALGYYQMGAFMEQERRAKAAEKREKAQNTEMEG